MRVTSAKPVDKVEIRPLSLGIKATVIGGNEIRFRLDKPMKVSVDINGKTDGGLIVFAGTPDARPPSPHDPNVRYFGPGIHEINDNEYHVMEVHSGQTIYVVGGAILRARILGDKVDHVRIAGRGIIDGSTLPSRFPEEYRKLVGEKDYKHRPVFIDFRDSHDITVEGVHIIDSPAWTLRFDACHDVAARDLRLIGYVPNSDGIDIVNSQRVVIADCFIRTSDDTIVLKGIQNRNVPRRGNVEDVLVERCTLWADRASALEIGHETEADEIRHVTFRDIDILEQLYGIIGYHAINMHAGDEALVHDILYDNIRVEHCQRLIGTKIEKGIFNRSKGWGRIQNVSFRNIQSLDKADVSLYGHSDENAISGFAFDNITLRGQPVTPELLANGFVRDLKFVSEGKTTTVDRAFPGDLKFEAVALGAAANHAVTKPFTDDPKTVVGPLPPGRSVLNSVPFDFPKGRPARGGLPHKCGDPDRPRLPVSLHAPGKQDVRRSHRHRALGIPAPVRRWHLGQDSCAPAYGCLPLAGLGPRRMDRQDQRPQILYPDDPQPPSREGPQGHRRQRRRSFRNRNSPGRDHREIAPLTAPTDGSTPYTPHRSPLPPLPSPRTPAPP